MNADAMDLARKGFEAWQQGDFDTIEALLDPGVEWRSFEPGEGDCHGRDDVMHVVRERFEQGFARGELDFLDGGAAAVIVVAHPRAIGGHEWPEEAATVLTFHGGKVVDMQDFRTRADALAEVQKSG